MEHRLSVHGDQVDAAIANQSTHRVEMQRSEIARDPGDGACGHRSLFSQCAQVDGHRAQRMRSSGDDAGVQIQAAAVDLEQSAIQSVDAGAGHATDDVTHARHTESNSRATAS